MNAGLFSSATNQWETPRWLFDHLDDQYHFELGVCADVGYAQKHNQVISLAVEALKEKAERSKGCVWCKENNKVFHDGKHFHMFCSYCGKRLEVEHGE